MAKLAEHWASLPWEPDRSPIHEWASRHVTIPAAMSFGAGDKFNVHVSRHFIAPLEALKNDKVRAVNIIAPPRTGKTLVADIYAPWVLSMDPGPLLWVFGVDSQAKKHCETRLMPILHGCPAIEAMLPDDRHKVRTTEILFSNGMPIHVLGPSISNLQARGYRYLIMDEVWEWPHGKMTEAETRIQDFAQLKSSKVLTISQGGHEDTEWSRKTDDSQWCEWQIQCLGCGVYDRAYWSGKHSDGRRFGVVFDCTRNERGQYDIDAAKRSVRYVCRHCGHEHPNTPETLRRWNLTGRYDNAPESGNVTFHWNDIICKDWSDLAAAWLKARTAFKLGDRVPLIQFFQKQLAEHASENRVMAEGSPITRESFDPAAPWDAEVSRIMTVDVQADGMFYVMARAWARSGESRRLFWGKVFGTGEIEAKRIELGIKPTGVIIDTGWDTRNIYTHCSNHGWVGIKGDPREWFQVLKEQPGVKGKVPVRQPYSEPFEGQPDLGKVSKNAKRCWVYRVSEPSTHERLDGLIERKLWKDPEVPDSEEEREYTAQLNSSVREFVRRGDGTGLTIWKQIRDANHARDCARYQVFAAMALGII